MSYTQYPAVIREGAPSATDDRSEGFVVGGMWINSLTSPRDVYVCADSSVGAAEWVLTNGGGGGGGTPASTVVSSTSYGQSPVVGVSTAYARADHTHGSVPVLAGLFGNGFDGNLSVTPGSTYTQTQERMWGDVYIPSTSVYKPAGYRVLVSGTLTIDAGGSMHDDGNSAVANVQGAALTVRGYLDASSGAGGAGYNLSTVQAGNGLVGGSVVNNIYNQSQLLPTGGASGISTTRAAGAAGTTTQLATGARITQMWPSGRQPGLPARGGSGGGGGAITLTVPGTSISGGGGSGAGIVVLFAKNLVNNGRISANGGNGGDANCPAGNNGAGGGGGGGGLVMVTTGTPYASVGTITANGGTGGTASGAGATNGANGTAGSVYIVSFGG